jgi:hypothetical protein
MERVVTKRPRRARGTVRAVALATLLAAATASPLAASSLDGAGRLVVLPYAVSGVERESMIYLTNPSSLKIHIDAMYVGAEGTPFAASVAGPLFCVSVPVDRLSGEAISLSKLCPRLSTADLENFGYLQFRVTGGFDAAPFFVTSVVNTSKGGRFAVEGVPAGAFDPGRDPALRQSTLRVMGLDGEVSGGQPITKMTHCYLATLGEGKNVTVQLMEHGSGRARPLGNLIKVSLPAFAMTKLGNVLAHAAVAPGRFDNLSAEFYAEPSPLPGHDDGAALIAGCSIETLASREEDFRLARTPSPRDGSRTRGPVAGDSDFRVGAFQIGYGMPASTKASMTLRPLEDPAPWQELRVFDPDGRVVAGGDNVSDTGIFSTGLKNGVAFGENGRWTVEVSWRESVPGIYPTPPGITPNAFGVRCESTSGVSALLPLPSSPDDF